MNTHQPGVHLGFTQEVLPDCNHVCLIFDNEAQRRALHAARREPATDLVANRR